MGINYSSKDENIGIGDRPDPSEKEVERKGDLEQIVTCEILGSRVMCYRKALQFSKLNYTIIAIQLQMNGTTFRMSLQF